MIDNQGQVVNVVKVNISDRATGVALLWGATGLGERYGWQRRLVEIGP